jgi:hypothetical protein
MLSEFLVTNREAIIACTRARVASRKCPKPRDLELTNGIPIFLDQLGDALRLAQSSTRIDHDEIGESAGRHGQDLLRMGLTIAQVVHDYGDVCQAITELRPCSGPAPARLPLSTGRAKNTTSSRSAVTLAHRLTGARAKDPR